MKVTSRTVTLLTLFSAFGCAQSQTSTTTPATSTVVPRLVSFNGVAKDANGKPLSGPISITFALYADQQGGSPLWSEMQATQADADGHYSVFLGAANGTGLPVPIFASGAARWLAVHPDVPGLEDISRVLLVGVPYAMKAADADTLGGKPASAYVTTESQLPAAVASEAPVAPVAYGVTAATNPTGTGTTDYIPLWTNSTTLGNSLLFQSGNNIGIGTTTPGSPLTLSSVGNAFPAGISYLADFVGSGGGNSAGTTNYRGLDFEITATGATFIQGFTSITGDNLNSLSEGTVAVQSIVSGNLRVNNVGNTTSGYGFEAIPILSSKGGVTSWEAFDARTPSIASSSAGITTAYGMYVEPQKVTGVTTGYGVYQAGASDTNYLAGKVGIGTATPAASLEVTGTAKFDGSVTFAGSQTDTGNVTTSGELISTVATGTAPLQVTSTTQVANLNASLLGGQPASAFVSLSAANTFTAANTFNNGLSGASSSGFGVQGSTSSTTSGSSGVYGTADNNSGVGTVFGVEGATSLGGAVGVYGLWGTASSVTSPYGGIDNAAVWGDSSEGAGIVGTSDQNFAAQFTSASSYQAVDVGNLGTGSMMYLHSPNGSCLVKNSGDLACTGSKSAVVPVDNAARKVALYAVEAPENWFEDFGSGRLSGGAATVHLESIFGQTVNTDMDYHVFITPKGESKGWLYVSNETAQGFEVHEAAGGQSNIAFDYRIVARRKGYEAIRLADQTKEFNPAQQPPHHAIGKKAVAQKSPIAMLNR